MVLGGLAEQIFQDRNLGQPRDSAELLGLLVFHDAAEQVRLTVFKADFMFNLPLSNDGLANAAYILLASDSGHVHRNLQSDFTVSVNARGDVNIDTYIQI